MHISGLRAILLATLAVAIAACASGDNAQSEGRLGVYGVIEGFYGPPWPHQDRLDVLRFMGRVGLDAYIYAPKDDPYHLGRWREPYPPERLEELRELVGVARESGVEFHYAISPGGSMIYSDSAEYVALLEKLETITALGVDHVAFFVDDVQPILQHESDRSVFDDLAHAHATIINRLYADLAIRGTSLVVTPTTYTEAWGDQNYARRLGTLTNEAVPFFWTGTDVVSPTITQADAERWTDLLGRRPIIWDNYPVNDFARWRLFLGPVRGRTAQVGGDIAGILSNPMNEAHASMIPLATLAAHADNAAGYDPDAALEGALENLYDDSTAVALEPFLDAYGDYSTDRNVFEPLFIPGRPIDVTETEDRVTDLRRALDELERLAPGRPDLLLLIDDLAPFVDRTAERLLELEEDDRYRRDGDLLVYRDDLDRYVARSTSLPVTIDGHVQDWETATFHPLFRNGRELQRNPRIAVRTQGERLILAIDVPGRPQAPESSPDIGIGDHVAVVMQLDTNSTRQGLSDGDLLLLLPAPANEITQDMEALSMRFHGFMSKYLADNRNMQFTAFHVSTFGQSPIGRMEQVASQTEYAARLGADRWQAEISLPMGDKARLGVFVTRLEEGTARTYSWSRRSYPANPATFMSVTRDR